MDHHVAYLPPPGLPISTEHNPNPQVSQNSSTSAIIHQDYAMYGQAIQQHTGYVLDAGKQTTNHHVRHGISQEGARQNHGDLRHSYQSDFIGLAKVTETPYSPFGPTDLSKTYQRVVNPTRSNMEFPQVFPRHLPARALNDLQMNLQKSGGNLRQTKSFTPHGIHPSGDLQRGMVNQREALEELHRGSPSLQVIDATKSVGDNQTILTAKDSGEHVDSGASFQTEGSHGCNEPSGEDQQPSTQSSTTSWEQIVGVAADCREETRVNVKTPQRELHVEFQGMETQRHSSPVNSDHQQQTVHGAIFSELAQEQTTVHDQNKEMGGQNGCDDADPTRCKDQEVTNDNANLSGAPQTDIVGQGEAVVHEGDRGVHQGEVAVHQEEGVVHQGDGVVGQGEEEPDTCSKAVKEVPKKNISIMVNENWGELMKECGFGDSHSDFAEFLVNWYTTNKEKDSSTETFSASGGGAGLHNSTSDPEPEMINKEIQTDYSCTCHQSEKDSTRKATRKPRRNSHQRKNSDQQVVIIAGVDESNSPSSCLPEEVDAVPMKSRIKRRRTSSTRSQTECPKEGAQGRAGQQTPRKRKLNETCLPYSPVPIYKTKCIDSHAQLDGKHVYPTKVEKRKLKFSETTTVLSADCDSSFESGVDADDRDSDKDFYPPCHESDSEDDSRPSKFHLSKPRTRSRKNSSSGKDKGGNEYVVEHNNPRAPLKIKFKQNRKLHINAAQAKKTVTQMSSSVNRKPRKPAKPKRAVTAKRPSKAKTRKEESIEMEQAAANKLVGNCGEQGQKEVLDTSSKEEGKSKNRARTMSQEVIKVCWSELLKQYQCKICQYDTPCITDMCLHLLDSHTMVIKELMQIFSKIETTCSSRTASIFEFLTGKKYDEVTNEENDQHKKLPPVSGILSNVMTTQETDSRVPPTSEIVRTALSQALDPVTNAMTLLHGGPNSSVFGTLGATGALPYIPGITHPTLGDVNHTTLHGSGAGYPTNFSRTQDNVTVAPSAMDSTVSLLNAAVTSQANSSQASSETDVTNASTEGDNREKNLSNFNESSDITSCQNDSTGSYQEKFRKSGVDVEELSKAIEVDQVLDVFEKWVKIRTKCPHCCRNIRVSKRSNMHRCKGSDSKPAYVLCDACGNSYQKEYFALHYSRLHLQSLVSCHICNKKFTASSLPKHLFKHTNPPAAFKCGTCTKSFRFRMDLERHELVHRVDKPYVCPTCGRGFTQKSNMQYHMRQHTGEQPYKCDNCMKSFTHNVSLKNHLKKHHGIDLWAMGYTGGGRPKKENRINSNTIEST